MRRGTKEKLPKWFWTQQYETLKEEWAHKWKHCCIYSCIEKYHQKKPNVFTCSYQYLNFFWYYVSKTLEFFGSWQWSRYRKNNWYGFSVSISRGEARGGGVERCAAARLGSSLCQGYKQAVIRPPNRIILPVSAPKHMGPHKAAAAPDRHPLLITQRRGAGPSSPHCSFSAVLFLHVAVQEIQSECKDSPHEELNQSNLYHISDIKDQSEKDFFSCLILFLKNLSKKIELTVHATFHFSIYLLCFPRLNRHIVLAASRSTGFSQEVWN